MSKQLPDILVLPKTIEPLPSKRKRTLDEIDKIGAHFIKKILEANPDYDFQDVVNDIVHKDGSVTFYFQFTKKKPLIITS